MNTKDLIDISCAEIKALVSGETTVQKATAIFRGCDSVYRGKEIEFKVSKYKRETGKDISSVDL